MPELSKRIATLNNGGTDGWDVFYKARRRVAAGEKITELTIGEPDDKTDPTILEAMHQSAIGGHTGYAAVPGTPELRAAVAERVSAQTGVPTTSDNVLITPGAQAALFAAHLCACDPGDTALFVDPFYVTYPGSIRGAGARPHAIVTTPENGFCPTAAQLAETPDASSLLINTPNNPTGTVYGAETMDAICDFVRSRDMWLISDEVYSTQVWDGTHISPRSRDGMADRTLLIGSMSKSHAMTGSRVGWLVGPEDAIAHLADLAIVTTYGVPGYIQDAAVFALAQGKTLEDKHARPFERRRDIAMQLLQGSNAIRVIPPMGAMYMMLDIRATGLSGEDFAHRLLDERDIAVMPGDSFGQAAAGHIRVAMTVDDQSFAKAISSLREFAESLCNDE